MRWMIVVVLLAAGLGAGAAVGWLRTPHYAPPPLADEARLRERATDFYRAQRLMSFEHMIQLYTPARQLKQEEELAAKLAETEQIFRGFDQAALDDQRRSADAVSSETLEVEVDGDWAITTGQATQFAYGSELPRDLEKQVWVRTGGDWWLYEMMIPELGAYGNPPAEWRKMLERRQQRSGGGSESAVQTLRPDQPTTPQVADDASGS